eukprot:scaffold57656_cov61-Attheya_sp.AAC.5
MTTQHRGVEEASFVAEYNTKDLLLYALAIGCGGDGSTDEDSENGTALYGTDQQQQQQGKNGETRFVNENHDAFSAFPTFPLVLSFFAEPYCGNDMIGAGAGGGGGGMRSFPPPIMKGDRLLPRRLLKHPLQEDSVIMHLSQSIQFHSSIPIPKLLWQLQDESSSSSSHSYDPPVTTFLATDLLSVQPKSVGTFVTTETKIYLFDKSQPLPEHSLLCTMRSTMLLLGLDPESVIEFHANKQNTGAVPLQRLQRPIRVPDWTKLYRTTQTQALLYRLGSSDYNSLHVNPPPPPDKTGAADSTKKKNSSAPILHGLCTMGFAARAALLFVTSKFPGVDWTMTFMECGRFRRPVFVGNVLRIKIWDESNTLDLQNGDAAVHVVLYFEVFNVDTNDCVVDSGKVEFTSLPYEMTTGQIRSNL